MHKQPLEFEGVYVGRFIELLEFQCSGVDCAELEREVTKEEKMEVLLRMPGNKAPGSDGYTSEFFKKAWKVLGEDIIVALQSIFLKGFLPKGLNSTIMSLISKEEEKMIKEIDIFHVATCYTR